MANLPGYVSYNSIPGESEGTASSFTSSAMPSAALFKPESISGTLPRSFVPPALKSQFSQPPTPPIVTGYQRPFFSQVSAASGIPYFHSQVSRKGSYSSIRVGSFSRAFPQQQQGHRRMKKISRYDLENMQWEKKSQPVRRNDTST